ncbi:formylglycine-generating enzyme family protein [Sorangium sp. So ce363]|uniref:formylglycine-generating enzyme family protein n=1 Tax=Sorangium sp. So ce363 TaxID=3133304 RepID=UPI003F60C254
MPAAPGIGYGQELAPGLGLSVMRPPLPPHPLARRPVLSLARSPAFAAGVAALGLAVLGLPSPRTAAAARAACPAGMASVRGTFCIDRFEASTVELLSGGGKRRHSPFEPVGKLKVKAVSRRGVKPQAYVSRDQAEAACQNAGKRLCTDDEWVTACRGKRATVFPYGRERERGACNDSGVSSFNRYFGQGGEAPQSAFTWANMNDARLNQLPGTLASSGAFRRCKSSFGVHDMVGNLHEWTSAPRGTFRGGYYLDSAKHGDGCEYKTTAHSRGYHDYSTGFRCCK